jgi:hypothetical protein
MRREPQIRQNRPLGRSNSSTSLGAVTMQAWQWIILIGGFELMVTSKLMIFAAATA